MKLKFCLFALGSFFFAHAFMLKKNVSLKNSSIKYSFKKFSKVSPFVKKFFSEVAKLIYMNDLECTINHETWHSLRAMLSSKLYLTSVDIVPTSMGLGSSSFATKLSFDLSEELSLEKVKEVHLKHVSSLARDISEVIIAGPEGSRNYLRALPESKYKKLLVFASEAFGNAGDYKILSQLRLEHPLYIPDDKTLKSAVKELMNQESVVAMRKQLGDKLRLDKVLHGLEVYKFFGLEDQILSLHKERIDQKFHSAIRSNPEAYGQYIKRTGKPSAIIDFFEPKKLQ